MVAGGTPTRSVSRLRPSRPRGLAGDLSWRTADRRRRIYRLGLALFDLKTPEVCLKRGSQWIFGPEESYELHGDVGNVVFPCGYTVLPDGDTVRFYYGAADTSIALATGSIRTMLDWLEIDG